MILFEFSLRVSHATSPPSTQLVHVAAADFNAAIASVKPGTGYHSFEIKSVKDLGAIQVVS
jgi:hypothetical protein